MLSPDGPVHPTPVARQLADVVLHPPLGPAVAGGPVARRLGPIAGPLGQALDLVPRTAAAWTLIPAVGLLPTGLREEYGLAWGPLEQAIDAWLVTAWRAWRPAFPPSMRWFPQALAADARVRAG